MDLDEVLRLFASLERHGVRYAVFGAVAMNLHGLVRATEAVDVFVEPTIENIERLKTALREVWNDPHIDEIDTQELIGEYPAARYFPPGTELYLDILTRLGEAFSWEELETERVEVSGVTVRVVTPRMLERMKADTVRPKDRLDAAWLRETFGFGGET